MGENLLALALVGYLIGSFPTGVVVGRLLGGKDPRHAGSGHTGALNTGRQAGRLAAALTLVLDVGKGALAVWLAACYGDSVYAVSLVGTAAVIGHCWSVWLRGRGGMGIATGAGAVAPFAPLLLPIVVVIWLAAARLLPSSYRAVAASAALAPLITLALGYPIPTVTLVLGASAVVYARHVTHFQRRHLAL